MSYPRTNFSAATAIDDDAICESQVMKVGAYTLIAAGVMPTAGARRLTFKRTVTNATPDTVTGGITVVGKNLLGQAISETIAVGADGVTVNSVKYYASVTTVTENAGWVKGGADADTIIVGILAAAIVAEGSGTLHGMMINTAAAGSVTIADASGTIAVVPANQAAGTWFTWDALWSGYLSVTAAAATNITVLHTGSTPSSYAKS